MEGIVGEGVELNVEVLESKRISTVGYELAKQLLFSRFREPDEPPRMHLFGDIKRVVNRWLAEGYLVCSGGTKPAMLTYPELMDQAAELIFLACQTQSSGDEGIRAILDPYNPSGSTRFVNFFTSKPLFTTNPARCHVNHVVRDSDWEAEFARVAETHPRVLAYVKNQGMQFEVPYRDGAQTKRYWPDFIVRLDGGRDEPLNVVVEVKGFRGIDAQLKAETMCKNWVPGVNNLGAHGRWTFAEFRSVHAIEADFASLVDSLVAPALISV